MRRLFHLFIFILFIDFAFQQCANPGRPTGGPKDTIPPTLISANPILGTTNFKNEIIELEFNEYINADKLKQQLIITPKTDLKFKHLVKRNRLILRLETKLLDSTTYSFNFGDGVSDITEKNPVINLSLAFSTGSYIDSLSIKGEVEDLLTKEPGKGYVVSLYPFSDTLDYFTDSPMYFTTANDSGRYKLNYLKRGKYKILSFNDDNGNFLLDPESESHGFLEQTIHLDSSTSLPNLRCILQNVKPIQLINARPTGPYVEIKYNKQILSYQILAEKIQSNLIGDNKEVIRLYKPSYVNYNDSIKTVISAEDSLGNKVNDTIRFAFLESNRKPAGFSYTNSQKSIPFIDNPSFQLNFNKPVIEYDTSKINIIIDSVILISPGKSIQWNQNRTTAKVNLSVQADSLLNMIEVMSKPDTTTTDSTSILGKNGGQRKLEIELEEGAFISAENDTSKLKLIPFEKAKIQPTGTLKIKLNSEITHFKLQLVAKGDKVMYQIRNQKNITFTSIKPDTYKIRILIDSNKDGFWSYGNLLKNQEPEEVYIHPEETSIRENWVVEMSISL